MASILEVAGLLMGEGDLNNQKVKDYADKIVSYCEGYDKKAERMDLLLKRFMEEAMPLKTKVSKEYFDEILEVTKAKIAEIGGVTGFLPEVEGKGEIKKS